MILPRYEEAFAALTPQELSVLLPALSLPLVRHDRPFTGRDLCEHARTNHISHADIIMSLAKNTTPIAVSIVERLIMRPIDRRTPYEVNISRLPRPPGSHRKADGTTSSPSRAGDDMVIRRLSDTNPKKPGSDSHVRFDYYQDGMSVAQYLAKGGRRPDLAWDTEKGFIKLEDPA